MRVWISALIIFSLNFVEAQTLPYADTMIVIAVDVSGSIDSKEYEIQKSGVVEAFLDSTVQSLLNQCQLNGVAVTYVEWSGSRNGRKIQQIVPWTLLQSASDMSLFAELLLQSPRSSSGDTDIAAALSFASELFLAAPFQSSNRVVSLSTDGFQDYTVSGVSVQDHLQNARNELASFGVSINAIAIESVERPSEFSLPVSPQSKSEPLENYLRRNIMIGPRSFVTPVYNFEAFSEAFKKQLYVMMNACIS